MQLKLQSSNKKHLHQFVTVTYFQLLHYICTNVDFKCQESFFI